MLFKNRIVLIIVLLLSTLLLVSCEQKLDYEKYDIYVEVSMGSFFSDKVTLNGTSDYNNNKFKPNIYLYNKKENSMQRQPTKSGSDYIFGSNLPWNKLDDFKLNGTHYVYETKGLKYNLVNNEEIEVFEAIRIEEYGSTVHRTTTYLVLVDDITEVELEYYTNDTIDFD